MRRQHLILLLRATFGEASAELRPSGAVERRQSEPVRFEVALVCADKGAVDIGQHADFGRARAGRVGRENAFRYGADNGRLLGVQREQRFSVRDGGGGGGHGVVLPQRGVCGVSRR